jgi:hypothetical protein
MKNLSWINILVAEIFVSELLTFDGFYGLMIKNFKISIPLIKNVPAPFLWILGRLRSKILKTVILMWHVKTKKKHMTMP